MTHVWHRGTLVAEVNSLEQGQVALLNVTRGRPLVLYGSAAIIWELIDGTRTEAAIIGELKEIYRTADMSEIEAGLTSFLRELAQQGLAEIRNDEAAPHG